MQYLILLFSITYITSIYPLSLQRIVLASNDNPAYLQFWPIVAKAWKQLTGAQPTLALIAHKQIKVDRTVGDVIRFDPIKGVSTALQAQVIRLLLPICFPDDTCLIADIDTLPLNGAYFKDSIQPYSERNFIIFRDDKTKYPKQYRMAYNAAKGKIWAEIFGVTHKSQISSLIKVWAGLNLGWFTDQILLRFYVDRWDAMQHNVIKLNHSEKEFPHIWRGRWEYDLSALEKGKYIAAHMPRPYLKHKAEINTLLCDASIRWK